MPRVYINYESFELIERREHITPKELAKAIGVKEHSAATWLSRWSKRGYLEYVHSPVHFSRKKGEKPGPRGYYKIGKKWWGALVYESERIDTEIRR